MQRLEKSSESCSLYEIVEEKKKRERKSEIDERLYQIRVVILIRQLYCIMEINDVKECRISAIYPKRAPLY